MEPKISRNGKKLWTLSQRRQMLLDLDSGLSPEEVSRKYDVRVQNLYRWRKLFREGGEKALRSNEEVVGFNEYKKVIEENKRLKEALGNMTLERDILKDGMEIAVKKKWI